MSAAVRAVLFVHGAGGGGWEWNAWRAVFAAHGIAPSAPDLMPAASLEDTSFDDYAAQARRWIASLPRPRALVGASLGGLLALACSDAADALVLVNPLPPAGFTDGLPSREWPDRVPWRHEARLASTRRALGDADEAAALFAFRRWRDESGAVLRAAQAGVALPAPVCPLLCIASGDDGDVPAGVTARLAGCWRAELRHLPGAGHVEPLLGRMAPRLAAEIAGWLAAC